MNCISNLIKVHIDNTCILNDPKKCVPCVMEDFSNSVGPVWHERPLRPSQAIEHTVPESKKPKRYPKVDNKPDKNKSI